MGNWAILVYVIGVGLLVWLSVRIIKTNPNAFSKENIGKSIGTVGILALVIIAIIAFCVWMLKA